MSLPKSLPVLEPPRPPTPNPAGGSRVALIALTTFCNARCRFCCVLDMLNKPELNPSDEQIRKEMEDARKDGCTTLGFTGGEPTVHPRFAEFCRYGKELGYESITVNTNGIQFRSRKFTERALEAGLSNIDFSIHGPDAELHDRMVERPGAFAAIEQGMAHLRELAPKYGAVLGATTVVTSTNANHVERLAKVLCDLGFQALRFKHCFEGDVGTDTALVGRYSESMPAMRAAVAHAHARGVAVQLVHFPLCLLAEEIVHSSDLRVENVLSVDINGGVVSDGRASMYRRHDGRACDRCLLRGRCAMLDEKYLAELGDSELQPFEKPESLTPLFARGADRYGLGEKQRAPISRLLEELGAPPMPVARPREEAPKRSHAVGSIHLGRECGLGCGTLCDCGGRPSDIALAGGGERLVLRGGGAPTDARLSSLVEEARKSGWREIWLRAGSAGLEPELLETIVAAKVGVVVPLFSHVSMVHDRVANRAGAHARAIATMRALAQRARPVAVEVPILPPKLQRLDAVVQLAKSAAPTLAAVRFHSPRAKQPPVLTPPKWSDVRPTLAAAYALCRELGLALWSAPSDGIVRCALPGEGRDFHPLTPARLGSSDGFVDPPVCASCAVREGCPGPTATYFEAHGEAGLVALGVAAASEPSALSV